MTATYRDKNTGLIAIYPARVAEKFPSLEEIDPETHECVGCKKRRPRATATPEIDTDMTTNPEGGNDD